MNQVKTDCSSIEKLHNEWLMSLCAYEEELLHIDAITKQLQKSTLDLHYQQCLTEYRNQIVLQSGLMAKLRDEVQEWNKIFLHREDKKLITLSEIIQNNRIRDKVRKAEQSIFTLKYQVNKLLSLAS